MSEPTHIVVTCPRCGHQNWFAQPYPYHAGYSQQGFLYNETGTCTLTWSTFDHEYAALTGGHQPWALSQAEQQSLEERLPLSPDGSRWSFRDPARCLHCRAPISGPVTDTVYYLRYPCAVDRDLRRTWGAGLRGFLRRAASVAPWSTRDVWLGLLMAVVLSGVMYGLAYLLLYLVRPAGDAWAAVFSGLAEVVLLTPVWWFARHRRHATLRQLGFRKFGGTWLAAGIGLLVSFYIFNGFYAYLLSLFGLQMQRDLTPTMHELSTPWPLVFAVVVLAPFAEEVFFRGFLFNGLRARMQWPWAALVSAALFAAAHLDPLFFLPAFALGFIFALVYQKTDSVWPGTILHFLVNSLAMAIVLSRL